MSVRGWLREISILFLPLELQQKRDLASVLKSSYLQQQQNNESMRMYYGD